MQWVSNCCICDFSIKNGELLVELENLETTEKLIEWFEWDNSG
jgi:hypothetical protein